MSLKLQSANIVLVDLEVNQVCDENYEKRKIDNAFTVHWGGKSMLDLTPGDKKVEKLPMIVSNATEEQILLVPKLENGTGLQMANATFKALKNHYLEKFIKAMCFDTTASNTGRKTEASVLLEKKLVRDLLHLDCRRHITEILLEA